MGVALESGHIRAEVLNALIHKWPKAQIVFFAGLGREVKEVLPEDWQSRAQERIKSKREKEASGLRGPLRGKNKQFTFTEALA